MGARDWSMMALALRRKLDKSPHWKVTRTTAKIIPRRAAMRRTRSWRMFFQAMRNTREAYKGSGIGGGIGTGRGGRNRNRMSESDVGIGLGFGFGLGFGLGLGSGPASSARSQPLEHAADEGGVGGEVLGGGLDDLGLEVHPAAEARLEDTLEE